MDMVLGFNTKERALELDTGVYACNIEEAFECTCMYCTKSMPCLQMPSYGGFSPSAVYPSMTSKVSLGIEFGSRGGDECRACPRGGEPCGGELCLGGERCPNNGGVVGRGGRCCFMSCFCCTSYFTGRIAYPSAEEFGLLRDSGTFNDPFLNLPPKPVLGSGRG